MAAKLLEGKARRGSDSADFYHRAGSVVKDKAADVSSRTSHYGVPQAPAKASIINALSPSNQWKQPPAGSINFYQPTKGETNGFNRQGPSHPFSVAPASRGLSHPTRVNSQRTRRQSEPARRHQVSQVRTYLSLYACNVYLMELSDCPSSQSFSATMLGLLLFAVICLKRIRLVNRG